MNRAARQLKPWPFWLRVVPVVALQNHGQPIRDTAHQLRPWPLWLRVVAPQNHGQPVRLTKRSLVGCGYFLYMKRCRTHYKCVASHVCLVCMLWIRDASLLPNVAQHGERRHNVSVRGALAKFPSLDKPKFHPAKSGTNCVQQTRFGTVTRAVYGRLLRVGVCLFVGWLVA